jgi:hypothetical protein
LNSEKNDVVTQISDGKVFNEMSPQKKNSQNSIDCISDEIIEEVEENLFLYFILIIKVMRILKIMRHLLIIYF